MFYIIDRNENEIVREETKIKEVLAFVKSDFHGRDLYFIEGEECEVIECKTCGELVKDDDICHLDADDDGYCEDCYRNAEVEESASKFEARALDNERVRELNGGN